MLCKIEKRRGAATVEFVVVLPILVTMFVGVNEVCSAIYLKEQVTIAAYEGGRVGIQRSATGQDAEDVITEFLDERGIVYDANSVVSFTSPGFSTAQALEHVTTTVTVPFAGNSLTGVFFVDSSVSASVTLRKEFEN